MTRYDKYKPSGIEWIGDIPEHWEVKRLKYLADANPSNIDKKSKEEEQEVYLCNYVDVYKNETIHSNMDFMKATASNDQISKFILKQGDVILTKDSESANDIGIPALVTESFDNVVCGYHLTHITPKDIQGEYLFRQFQCRFQQSYFEVSANGVTRFGLGTEKFTSALVVIPEKSEQTAIATYLNRKTAEIDSIIANKQKLITLYEEEKQTIINHAVTRGVDKNVKLKPSGVEWLGDIPEHWEVKRLKYISHVQTGRTPKIQSSDIDFFENGNINWFTPADFEGNSELIESRRKLNVAAIDMNEVELFPNYSIYLVSIGATLGKVSFFSEKASANQQINIISFNNENYYPLFGYYFFVGNKEMIALEADYTTLPIINQTKTRNLTLTLPPLIEQQAIVAHIEKECSRLDTLIAKFKKQIELFQEYRTTLISEVVTGKVRV